MGDEPAEEVWRRMWSSGLSFRGMRMRCSEAIVAQGKLGK